MARPLVLRLLLRDHAQAAGVWKTVAGHTSISTVLVIFPGGPSMCGINYQCSECVHASSVNILNNRIDNYLVMAGYS